MLAKYKFQNTALLMSEIILVNFERLRYTSCNIVNVDHNKNKKRKHCPRMRKRDCNPPLNYRKSLLKLRIRQEFYLCQEFSILLCGYFQE